MKKKFKTWIPAFAGMTMRIALVALGQPAFAKGPGTDTALNLSQLNMPRPSSLGEAFTAMHDDVSALSDNPSSLATLSSSQFLFSHDQGAFGDSRNALLAGFKTNKGALGFGIGRYDTGKVTLYDGTTPGPVSKTAQEDLLVDVGYGYRGKHLALGGSLKYLSSTLAESARATGYLLDVGANMPLKRNLRVGLSLPVLATDVKYGSQSEKLPRVIRTGFSYQTNFGYMDRSLPPVLFLMDVPYSVNEREVALAAGVDVSFGLMSLRMGYQTGQRLGGFSVGTGFQMNSLSVDYSFGIVGQDSVDSLQKVSLSYRMGTPSKSEEKISKVYERTESQKRVVDVLNNYYRGSTAAIDSSPNQEALIVVEPPKEPEKE